MKVVAVIAELMKEQKVTQSEMARRIGAKTASVVSGRLRNGSISTANAIEMLDKLDWDIYAVPRGYGVNSNITAKPIKLSVYDDGEIPEEDRMLAAYKAKLTPEGLAEFESKPLEVQMQIAALMS